MTIVILSVLACGREEPPAGVEKSVNAQKPAARAVRMPKQMRHCTPCHSIRKGEKHKIGPNLFGVVGRKVGTAPGYNYSKEYRHGNWIWTRENIDLLINKKNGTVEEAVRKLTGNPKARTKMKFYGAKDEDAQKILDYLETLK